jgi:hypothetical protein
VKATKSEERQAGEDDDGIDIERTEIEEVESEKYDADVVGSLANLIASENEDAAARTAITNLGTQSHRKRR